MQSGKADFETLEKKAIEWGEPSVASGKQVIDDYVAMHIYITQFSNVNPIYRGSQ